MLFSLTKVELSLVWWFVLNVYASREETVEKIQLALEDVSGTGI